jgi:SAM-dependent methyltransferase
MSNPNLTSRNIVHWDQVFASRSWGRYPPEELVRFVARTFRDPAERKTLKVLEVGCGPGANLWYLAREGFQISGIDGSAHAIGQARERLRAENLGAAPQTADLLVGNFATLPWPDATFDAVIDIEAISANTLPTIRSVLAEIERVLKPGGWLFSKMFGPKTSGILTGRLVDDRTTENPSEGALAGVGVLHAFTEEEIRSSFEGYADLKLDWVHRSDANGLYELFEWLVQARK